MIVDKDLETNSVDYEVHGFVEVNLAYKKYTTKSDSVSNTLNMRAFYEKYFFYGLDEDIFCSFSIKQEEMY